MNEPIVYSGINLAKEILKVYGSDFISFKCKLAYEQEIDE